LVDASWFFGDASASEIGEEGPADFLQETSGRSAGSRDRSQDAAAAAKDE
jgi:hypothetical protein